MGISGKPILHLSTTPFKNQNNNLPQTIKPQIKTTSILTNIDNEFTKQSKHSRKNYLLQSPNVIIKFRLLLCNWCTIYMVSYDHYGFLAFFNNNLTGKRTPAAATKLQCFGTTRWYQWYHGTKYVGTTRYHYI